MSDTAHARFSPSAAHRWMTCSASVTLESFEPRTSSEFADEGTAAHTLASMSLTENRDPSAYLGRVIKVNEGTASARVFTVDAEMADYVRVYVEQIQTYAAGHHLFVEQQVDFSEYVGVPEQFGTSDAGIITADGEEIQVHDLKYGRGVRVDAEENEQLMLYALGFLSFLTMIGMAGGVKRVRMVIHQPRLEHLSEWDCSVEELLEFSRRAASAVLQAQNFATIYKTSGADAGKSYFNPGTKQCRFCKVKAKCRALAEEVSNTVFGDFDVIGNRHETATPVQVPRTSTALLSAYMARAEMIEDWLRAVRAEVETQLFAGNEVPGWKLVEGRKGNRAWSSEEEAAAMMKTFRLKQDEMYSFKLITPAAAETLLKKESPRQWKKLAGLITQSDGKPSVAPAGDKRTAITIGKVEDDFTDLTAGA